MTTSTQKCPICGIEHIPAEKNQCPQCDADLSCFKMLEKIPDETAVPEKPSKSRIIVLYALVLSVILLLGLAVFQLYRFKQLERVIADQKAYLTNSIAGADKKIEKKIQPVKPQPPAAVPLRAANNKQEIKDRQPISEPYAAPTDGQQAGDKRQNPDSDFRFYEANDEDTLWDIAEAHYGSGHYYPVLLEHNPHIGIYGIGNGVRLKILKNTRQVRTIYRRIVIKEGDHIFWNYTVREGDTLQSLLTKFYKPEDIAQISGFTPEESLHPGRKIKILLK